MTPHVWECILQLVFGLQSTVPTEHLKNWRQKDSSPTFLAYRALARIVLDDVMAKNVRLLTYVPELDGDGSLGDLAHVEADGWNHVLVEGPAGDHIDEGRLSSMLQPHQGQLHLLLQLERSRTDLLNK